MQTENSASPLGADNGSPLWTMRIDDILRWTLFLFCVTLPITISLAEPLAFLLVVLWMVRRGTSCAAWRPVPRSIALPMAAFAALALLASASGPRPAISLWKSHRLLYLLIPFAIGDLSVRSGVRVVLGSLRCYLLGVLLLGIYDLSRVAWVAFHRYDIFDSGNMRDPQFYMTAICLILGLAQTPFRSRYAAARVAIYLAGLVGHFKRGAWAGAIGGIMAMGLARRRFRRFALGMLGAIVIFLAIPAVRVRLKDIPAHLSGRTGGRGVLWGRVAPRIIADHPWGVGLGAVQHSDLQEYSGLIQPGLNHLHNNLLEITLETGWLGGVVWLTWVLAVLAVAWRGARSARSPVIRTLLAGILGAYCALLINGLVEYNFGDGEIFLLFCLMMGWLVPLVRCHAASEGETGRELGLI
ncbi:MAG TPA: O-antigen ligase domain-containing protein [Kiritimatiellae bacterium]|nr:O-antigen ligase domain-containing protein [Kiritimatiellia bacterium]